jgi:hypothetical protein
MGIDNREIYDPFATLVIGLRLEVTGSTVRWRVRVRRRWVIVIVWGVGHRREQWVMHFGWRG